MTSTGEQPFPIRSSAGDAAPSQRPTEAAAIKIEAVDLEDKGPTLRPELKERLERLEAHAASLAAMVMSLTTLLRQRGVLNETESRVVLAAALEIHRDPKAPKDLPGILQWATTKTAR